MDTGSIGARVNQISGRCKTHAFADMSIGLQFVRECETAWIICVNELLIPVKRQFYQQYSSSLSQQRRPTCDADGDDSEHDQ